MTQITSRTQFDAIDPQALADAVLVYLVAAAGEAAITDEADIALEAALLEQGVIAPHEVITHIAADLFSVEIHLDDGSIFEVNISGQVTAH